VFYVPKGTAKSNCAYKFTTNITVYIVRKMKGTHMLADSSPCLDCYNKMCDLNVRTIVYSSTNGEVVKQRLRDYVPKVISLGRQFINNGYNPIYRDKASERQLDSDTDSTISKCDVSSVSSYDTDDAMSISSNSSSSSSTTMRSKKSRSTKSRSTNKFIKRLIKNKNKYH
jgi:hypothetical protein